MQTPKTISKKEWEEIIKLEALQQACAIQDIDSIKDSALVMGTKFDYVSDKPSGYSGDLFLIMVSGSPNAEPMRIVLARKDGHLVVID